MLVVGGFVQQSVTIPCWLLTAGNCLDIKASGGLEKDSSGAAHQSAKITTRCKVHGLGRPALPNQAHKDAGRPAQLCAAESVPQRAANIVACI